MRVVLVALNARYIHSNLAIRYLKNNCQVPGVEIAIREYSINEHPDDIAGDVLALEPDVAGFSCYIWNIELVRRVARRVKLISPRTVVVFGGPEVSFDPAQELAANPAVDMVVYGEGEETFRELVLSLKDGREDYNSVAGLAWRGVRGPRVNPPRELLPLEKIKPPYQSPADIPEDKIVYYETSRGCPFRCAYCLSSLTPGVRYLPLERVRQEIAALVAAGVEQVKLVDRTFNCHRQRALEIMKYIVSLGGNTRFHFEAAGDLFDQEMLDFLTQEVPAGLFELEIGVQSTNPAVLERVGRRTDFVVFAEAVSRLRRAGNIHLHLDLIAGLPGEDVSSCYRSFDDVYRFRPHFLQPGFLKLLKGSSLRERAEEYGYKYVDEPPYEVLASKWLPYWEMRQLKKVEEVVEKIYNSGLFAFTLEYLLTLFSSPSAMYRQMVALWEERNFFHKKPGAKDLFNFLYSFGLAYGGREEVLAELLSLDWVAAGMRGALPFIRQEEEGKILRDEEFISYRLPELTPLSPRERGKTAVVVPVGAATVAWLMGGDWYVREGLELRLKGQKEGLVIFFRTKKHPVTGRLQGVVVPRP